MRYRNWELPTVTVRGSGSGAVPPIMEHDAVTVESTSGLARSHEIRRVNCFSGAYLAMRG
jgi:hypothetical protein